MQLWEVARDEGYLTGMIPKDKTLNYWTATFQAVYEGKIDTWDYQWTFSRWLNHMLAVLPQVNLISNIGFGEEATHTRDPFSELAYKALSSMDFPLIHPPFVVRHEPADRYTDELQFHVPGLRSKISCVSRLIRNRNFRILLGKIAARLTLLV
jgi:hypothetical protein